MEPDPIGSDARRRQRERRLGPDAVCMLCPTSDPEALRVVDRSLLERHHVVARQNDSELTVILCANHHLIVTEGQRRAGVVFEGLDDPSGLRRLESWLRGLADFFARLAASAERCAVRLGELLAFLDDVYDPFGPNDGLRGWECEFMRWIAGRAS